MSLLVVTDTRMRAQGHWSVGPRLRTILAVVGLGSQPVLAEEMVTFPRELGERRVVLGRPPGERPTTIYGTADKPLLLVFDAPLGKGPVRAPGMEIRRQPSSNKKLVLTPSRALAASRGSVPVVVPLETGAVTLTLVFKPEAPDRRVDVYRPGEPARLTQVWKPNPRPETLRNMVAALASQPFEMVVSTATEPPIPSAAVKCRMSFTVRMPEAQAGFSVELRSVDGSLCERPRPPSTRVDGDR